MGMGWVEFDQCEWGWMKSISYSLELVRINLIVFVWRQYATVIWDLSVSLRQQNMFKPNFERGVESLDRVA